VQVELRFGRQARALESRFAVSRLIASSDSIERAPFVFADLQQGAQHTLVDVEQVFAVVLLKQVAGAAFQARAQQDRPPDDRIRVAAAPLDRVGPSTLM